VPRKNTDPLADQAPMTDEQFGWPASCLTRFLNVTCRGCSPIRTALQVPYSLGSVESELDSPAAVTCNPHWRAEPVAVDDFGSAAGVPSEVCVSSTGTPLSDMRLTKARRSSRDLVPCIPALRTAARNSRRTLATHDC
jgi:hypothetical protein